MSSLPQPLFDSAPSQLRLAIYLRVSTLEQTYGFSLDAQERLCRAWAANHNAEIVRVYKDAGLSGFRGKRTEFAQLMFDASKDRFDAVVVHRWDRFGRDKDEVLVNKFMLRKKWFVRIFSVTEPSADDEDSIRGEIIESTLEYLNHWYSHNLSQEVMKGNQEKHQQGYHLGVAPFGYKKVGRELEVDAEEAARVRYAFSMYASENYTYRDVAFFLNDMKFVTKKGHQFSQNAIIDMLSNPVYVGKVRYRPTTYNPDGSRRFDVPFNVLDGRHTPIISEEMFSRISVLQKRYQTVPRTRRSNDTHLLQGLTYCEHCLDNPPENPLPAWGRMSHRTHPRHGIRYIHCTASYRGAVRCSQGSIDASIIEANLMRILGKLSVNEQWVNELTPHVARKLEAVSADQITTELKAFKKKIETEFKIEDILNLAARFEKRFSAENVLNSSSLRITKSELPAKAQKLLKELPTYFELHGHNREKLQWLLQLIVEGVYLRNKQITRIRFCGGYELTNPLR